MVLITGMAFVLLAGCGSRTPSDGWDAQDIAKSVEGTPVRPIVVNSNIGVGSTRLAVALTDSQSGAPLSGARVKARLFWIGTSMNDRSAFTERGSIELVPRSLDLALETQHDEPHTSSAGAEHHTGSGNLVTMYTGVIDVDRAGYWGVELDATGDVNAKGMRLTFYAQPRTTEPMVGEVAPRSIQPALTPGGDATKFTTAEPPNPDFVDTTIAEAIDSGRPVVVAFVTPAFCVTRFCGPVLQAAIQPLYDEFRGRVEFIQVEPYDLVKARAGEGLVPIPTVDEWKLQSEPFVFVLAPGGKVGAKFEGVMDAAELRAAIQSLVK